MKLNKIFTWLGVFIISALLIGKLNTFFGDEKKVGSPDHQTERPSEEQVIAVTPEELLVAYAEDTVAANKKYKGKSLVITGHIYSTNTDTTDSTYLLVRTGTEFEFINPNYRVIPREKEEKSTSSPIKLKKVTLHCIGNSEILGTPVLSNCHVQSMHNISQQ
jgi:hypothetical protein